MIDVHEEPLSNSANASRVKSATHHTRIYLLWVLFVSFFIVGSYQLNYLQSLSNLSYWFIGQCIISLIGWFTLGSYFRASQPNLINMDGITQLFCLLTGCSLGIGVLIINTYLVFENNIFSSLQRIMFAGAMLSLVYILGISYLTQRFRYFLFAFIPSAIPVFFAKFLFPDHLPSLYVAMINVWLISIFTSALISHKIHRRLDILNLKNNKLFKQSQKHLEEANQLQVKLQDEVARSQQIKNELQLNNQLLEQKVKERTHDIKQINDHLENHQANLDFAHEAAGINSWLWNIEKRTFSISQIKFEQTFQLPGHSTEFQEKYIHHDDIANYRMLIRQHLRGFSERFEATYRIKKDQEWIWIQDIGKVIARHPVTRKPLRMVGIHRDIQKERNDQEQLKLASNVFEQVAEGVFVLDNNLCYLDVNPYFEKLVGFSLEEISGKHLFDITVNSLPDTIQKHTEFTRALISKGEYDAELYEEFTSGRKLTLWVHLNAITDDKNKVINYVGIVTDLTERIKQEQRLNYMENFDALTDLPNRFYFNRQLHHYVTSNNQALQHFALIRVNIDRFRSFNESLSNLAGDELLRQVSERLRQSCSDALLIAYLNNDDFAIIYNLNFNPIPTQERTRIILDALRQPFLIQGKEQIISISIGVALYPEHGRQIDSLNSHAELALAKAKSLGGNTIQIYANQNAQLLNLGINLESDLHKALKEKQFEVFYQPKICIQTKRIYGFEALIRWIHPELGLISPERFIPLAEETSLITEIGKFVLFETCRQIKEWQSLGFDHIRVSINIVAQQIHRGHLIQDIDEALNTYRIYGDMLELELTESSLLDKSNHVIELLQQIKARHISISLDDFGTGYSSLAYLTTYPIDTLKIDKAFISKIGQEKDEAIVIAIIALGTAIGMTLVAEGVETEEQITFLERHGCYILQGYYYSKPLSKFESTKYLLENKLIVVSS